MNTPKISFIVPVYNSAQYLAECLESVLAQTIDKEIIIINDGSTDDSLAMCLDYAKRYPFITLIHSRNEGLSAARNKGIRLARGEYLYFIDSDDYLMGDRLGEIYQLAHTHQTDVVKLQTELFKDDTGEIYHWPPVTKDLQGNSGQFYLGHQFFVALTFKRWVPCVCWSLIKREYLLKHQLFFKEGMKAEDQIFYTQLLTADESLSLLELPVVIYRYRQRDNSITNSKNDIRYIFDLIAVMQWLDQYSKQNAFSDNVLIGLDRISQHLAITINQQYAKLDTALQEQYRYIFLDKEL